MVCGDTEIQRYRNIEIQKQRPENKGESGERAMYRVLIADDEEIERLSFSRKLKSILERAVRSFMRKTACRRSWRWIRTTRPL